MRMRLETPTAAAAHGCADLHQQYPTTGQEAAAAPAPTAIKVDVGEKIQREGGSSSSSPKTEDSADSRRSEEDAVVKLSAAEAEMGEVQEENQRLKHLLQQIEKDYKSLQLRFFNILQNRPPNQPPPHDQEPAPDHHHLVSLSLGRSTSSIINSPDHPENNNNQPLQKVKQDQTMMKKCIKDDDEDEEVKASLTLGLDSKFQLISTTQPTAVLSDITPENSTEDRHQAVAAAGCTNEDDEAAETWHASKIQKVANNNISGGDDQDQVGQHQTQVKRARVSVRARCDAPTMNDGCQWRKYGQKIAKGNPCPRAYYRCTVAPGCPVRKQVQRCSDDMSILITTYEGTHSHPLPVSATAMASTTSAAASMLLSGSSSTSRSAFPTTTGELNMSFYDTSRSRPFYLPTTSPSQLFPTITLDLTSSPSTSSSSPSYFNRFPSAASHLPARYPSTSSLSFASSDNLPSFWGTPVLPYKQENGFLQSFLEKSKSSSTTVSQQSLLTETLTKTIASDPSFRSVIAAAISSMVGKNGDQQGGGTTESSLLVQNLVEKLTSSSQNQLSSVQNGKGSSCGSTTCFNGFASSSSSATAAGGSQAAPPGGLVYSQPPFLIFNSAAAAANSCPSSNKLQERKNT